MTTDSTLMLAIGIAMYLWLVGAAFMCRTWRRDMGRDRMPYLYDFSVAMLWPLTFPIAMTSTWLGE